MSDGWNGSGAFSVSVDMSANAAAGINIVASAFSNQMDVVKTGINACLTKNGENVPTGNLPMAGYQHTGTGKGSAVDSYSRVNEFIHLSPLYMIDNEAVGSATVSCTATPWPASLSAGMHVYVKVAGNKPDATGGNVVIKINALSANCSANDGTQLWPGAFTSGQIHELVYDGSNFKLLNPGYKVATATLQVKARTAGGAVTTASTTVSCSVEMWREGQTATVIMAVTGGSRKRTTWQTSTGTAIYLSALPSWVRPTIPTRYVQQILYASGSTERFGSINVSTDGKIVVQNAGNNFGDDATIFPFQITYPVK